MRGKIDFGLTLAVLLLSGAAPGVRAELKPDPRKLGVSAIQLEATPITSFARFGAATAAFGKLVFRGGLVLRSPDSKNFGGWSGLVLDDAARKLFAVSDSGVWMTGELTYADGRLSGLTSARIGPILASNGLPLKHNKDRDAEATAVQSGSLDNGELLIAFEQKTRIVRYPIGPQGLSEPRGGLDLPEQARRMRRNGGFEAMTVAKGGSYKGSVIALSERLYNAARNHTGWIWINGKPETFYVENIDDYDLTDIATDRDGTMYVLERRFRWLEGVKMRLRRFAPGEIAPGRTAVGETLVSANLEYEIDNMEGLAVTSGADGETMLTLISDDNFNHFLQRTILLQFTVAKDRTAKTRP